MKTLEQRIEEHEKEIRLWQESYDIHPDGANTTALHDLKNGLEIIRELQAERKKEVQAAKLLIEKDKETGKVSYRNPSILPYLYNMYFGRLVNIQHEQLFITYDQDLRIDEKTGDIWVRAYYTIQSQKSFESLKAEDKQITGKEGDWVCLIRGLKNDK